LSDISNPRVDYEWPPSKTRLVLMKMDEQPVEFSYYVPDTTSDNWKWKVTCHAYRYVFTQIVRCTFTDPTSYGNSERTPPSSVFQSQLMAEHIAIVDLATAMGPSDYSTFSAKAKISSWEIIGHNLSLEEPGIYHVDFILAAYSDYIISSNSWRKQHIPKPSETTDASTA
jgi:hypothetical protein